MHTKRRDLLRLAFAHSLFLGMVCVSSPASADDRTSYSNCYQTNRASLPPMAYLCAHSYLAQFGLDKTGLPMKRWADAYEKVATRTYGADSSKFGLVYGDLNWVQASALWSFRNGTIGWVLNASKDATMIDYDKGSGGHWIAFGLPAKFYAEVPTLAYAVNQPGIAIWTPNSGGGIDWQAIRKDGTAANKESSRTDLIEAITPVNGHNPTRLFASADGNWVLIWDDVPKALCSPATQPICDWVQTTVFKQNYVPRLISIGNNGSWIGIFGDVGYHCGGCAPRLLQNLAFANKNGLRIESAALFPSGGWYLKVATRK